MTTNSPSNPLAESALLQPAQYFAVVDAVLQANGRDRLPEDGVQRRIIGVDSSDRVLQILAGPGSGKTEMIVWRLLYDLMVAGANPGRIIVTTFTKRAATELIIRASERAEALQREAKQLGIAVRDPQIHNVHIGTIHSLCEQILVDHNDAYREDGRTMMDQAETFARMNRSHYSLGKDNTGPVTRLLRRGEFLALFTKPWEDNTLSLSGMRLTKVMLEMIAQHFETWTPRCEQAGTPNGVDKRPGVSGVTTDLIDLAARWEDLLADGKVVDFATIQRVFLHAQPDMIDHFDHIFVDEFQDSNPIQFAIHTAWLTNPTCKLTVVGDDDQALYRFRGSDIDCFHGLRPHCEDIGTNYRAETLETNYRSTKTIVDFCQAFKNATVLRQLALPKSVRSNSQSTAHDQPIRHLAGPWRAVCEAAAKELAAKPVGREDSPESAAVIMFSAREKAGQRSSPSPAFVLRQAMEAEGLRVFNTSSKTATDSDSPVSMLLGLLSYLIDPVTKQRVGASNRSVEVWASCYQGSPAACSAKRAAAYSADPHFPMNGHHIACQKKFVKDGGGRIGQPTPDRKRLTDLLDQIREDLIASSVGGRLTIAGLVARLLADPLFRGAGYTMELFRQALFTQLLEANIAPTRLTMRSLDQPLNAERVSGKVEWQKQYWELLHHFGGYVQNEDPEDQEVEFFEQDAVILMTHHTSKGLEFDHVIVTGIGREIEFGPVLRTKLFSGQRVGYELTDTSVTTSDPSCNDLAMADREREAYVAMSRAEKSLTILQEVDPEKAFMAPNPALETLFEFQSPTEHPDVEDVEVRLWHEQ